MAVTPTTFKVRFPEFGPIADPRIQLFLDDADLVLNESFWGDKYDLGIAYYTAHYLQIGIEAENGNSGSSGPIVSQSVDGVSIAFGQANTPTDQSDIQYASTSYGQRYLALRKSLGSGAMSV